MKGRLTFLAVALLVAPILHAQTLAEVRELTPIARPAGAPETIADGVRSLRERAVAKVIGVDLRDSAFLIPIAGNTAGGNGTYFRSDVTIGNYRSAMQNIGVGWLVAGADNTHNPLSYFTIPANSVASIDDFVGKTLNKTGLGGILIFGVDSAGNDDSNASLDGFSRIWTNQPGALGTVSQNFDAVTLTDSIGSLTAYIVGLKQSSDFRANVGVVNLDSVAHSWTATSVQTGAVTTLTVPAYSVVQTGVAAGSASASSPNVVLTLKSDGFGFYWSAYASSTDNRTGDGWVARAKQ